MTEAADAARLQSLITSGEFHTELIAVHRALLDLTAAVERLNGLIATQVHGGPELAPTESPSAGPAAATAGPTDGAPAVPSTPAPAAWPVPTPVPGPLGSPSPSPAVEPSAVDAILGETFGRPS
jgi:hypothetical protein